MQIFDYKRTDKIRAAAVRRLHVEQWRTIAAHFRAQKCRQAALRGISKRIEFGVCF